jgi:TRAP-type mannitol/chloroaromatic compound transport system permease small subunit
LPGRVQGQDAETTTRHRPAVHRLGQTFRLVVLLLTIFISAEVFSRYVLGKPHAWMFDVQIMLYGILFMMAGAYTLSKNGHVRGDVLYGFFRPRTRPAGPDPLHPLLPAGRVQ